MEMKQLKEVFDYLEEQGKKPGYISVVGKNNHVPVFNADDVTLDEENELVIVTHNEGHIEAFPVEQVVSIMSEISHIDVKDYYMPFDHIRGVNRLVHEDSKKTPYDMITDTSISNDDNGEETPEEPEEEEED